MFDSKKEKSKLNKILKNLPVNKKKIAEGLIADASFMVEQLEKLRECINENGWYEVYKNGANQYGRKISVEADTYLKLQKNYAAIIKQLSDYLPDDKADRTTAAGNALGAFVSKGKNIELR